MSAGIVSSGSKPHIYWPDGSQKEAPRDGFVWFGNADTYTWDDFLGAWVSGYQGNRVDFTPTGMPSKVYYNETEAATKTESRAHDTSGRCQCGAHAVGSPRHSSWCDLYGGGQL